MIRNFITITLVILFAHNCAADKSEQNQSKNARDSFSKIDKKDQALFTKEERKKRYENSLAISNGNKSSLKKNVTYNGYGSKSNTKKNSVKKKINNTEKKKKKASYLNSSGNSANQNLITLPYSTN
ncbi:MAG: hypothetical protein ACJ0PP_00760 [Flavobacteriaceae bacterium]